MELLEEGRARPPEVWDLNHPFLPASSSLMGGGGARRPLLAGDVTPHLTGPAVHLLAEVVIPLAVRADLRAVFACAQLVALPVVGLSGSPVPKKASKAQALSPSPQKGTVREVTLPPQGWGVWGA